MNTTLKLLAALMGISALGIKQMAFAQTNAQTNPLRFGGYAEVYYTQDFNKPGNHTRPGFLYSHNRSNEINLNLAYVKASYSADRVRSNLALAAGTYMSANYAAENDVMKNVYEANVGVRLSAKHDLWIDAGIMPSHLGFESAVGKDNWALTRSLFAENSPYFETGAKITYTTSDGRWMMSALILNGWQRIRRVDGNSTLSFGHQLTFKPAERLTLNSGSFVGSDQADSIRQMRYFHNLYAICQVSERFGLTAGFDIGAQQQKKGSKDYDVWYTPVLLARYTASDKVSLTARGEYYQDKKAVIIASDSPNGFQTFGYSANIDYHILSNVIWRTELRNLNSKDAVFTDRNQRLTDNSFTATTALAISF
ncbi:porin [Sphingobacterium spiritivorum]|uniref:porin n=1 Tax=Sphingobacterium spiritivorum TaxID=258 RepID=UPI003DA4564F